MRYKLPFLVYIQEGSTQLPEGAFAWRNQATDFARRLVDDATRNTIFVVNLNDKIQVGIAFFAGDGETVYEDKSGPSQWEDFA